MRYSPERKEAVLQKMMPPHHRPIKELAREEGISEVTLYNWRKEAREKGILMPDGDQEPSGWSARDKFAAVLECSVKVNLTGCRVRFAKNRTGNEPVI